MLKLFEIISLIETADETRYYEDYIEWCDANRADPMPMRHYRHKASALEQKWIALDAVQRQLLEDPNSIAISRTNVLAALEAAAVAPSLESIVTPTCEAALSELILSRSHGAFEP